MIYNIGLFFGSDTGNTKRVSNIIKYQIENTSNNNVNLVDISKCKKNDFEKYNFLILGTSTWYYGELQYDWLEFIPILENIEFNNKKIAIFGCGDQKDYSEYFCDGMYFIWNIISKNNGNIIGNWPKDDYYFKKSKSIINNSFLGLAIDEDNQKDKTNDRVKEWVKIILK